MDKNAVPVNKKSDDSMKKKPSDDNQKSVTGLLAKISSGSENQVYRALVDIRTNILKQSDGLSRLRQRGGPQVLLNVLEKSHTRAHDVCLSVLGNCCMDDKFRTQVLQRDGVPVIGVVLQESKSESIQNRACRTLGNLSLDAAGSKDVHKEEGLLEAIIDQLKRTVNPDVQQTYIRTIRLVSDTESNRRAVLSHRGLKVVADLLPADNDLVSQASLKAVNHFINEHPTAQCALQLDLAGVPKHMMTVIRDGESESRSQQYECILHIMMKYECFRPGLGNNGAVEHIIAKIGETDLSTDARYANINALCLLCKESLNRVRIQEGGGLELLLQLLSNEELALIHNRIISSLVCFLYYDTSVQILLQNNIINIFMKQLAKLMKQSADGTVSSNLNAALSSIIEEVKRVDQICVENSINMTTLQQDKKTDAENEGNQATLETKNQTKHRTSESEEGSDNEQEIPLEVFIYPDPNINKIRENTDPCSLANDGQVGSTIKDILPKYSMDSPTYKEISESHLESSYDVDGPRNISECQDFAANSPPGWYSPPHSPGSPLVCQAIDFSDNPLSDVSGYVSPTWSLQGSSADDRSSPTLDRPLSPLSCDVGSPGTQWSNSPSKISPQLRTSSTWPGDFSSCNVVQYASPKKCCESDEDIAVASVVTPQFSSSEEEVEEEENNEIEPELESNQPASNFSQKNPQKITVANILIFLSRVSFMDNPNRYLSKWCVLDGLLGLLIAPHAEKDENWKRAYRILVRIFKTPCLEAIVSNAMPLIIRLMCAQKSTRKLSKVEEKNIKDSSEKSSIYKDLGEDLVTVLSMEAQTEYGCGIVRHLLKTGDMLRRMKTFLCLPLLYGDPGELRSMMSCFSCGTELVLDQLEKESGVVSYAAVIFLTGIFRILHKSHLTHANWHSDWQKLTDKSDDDISFADRKVSHKRMKHSDSDNNSCPGTKSNKPESDLSEAVNEAKHEMVTLFCSNDEQIIVSKNVLCESSEVFGVMLNGPYAEASRGSVDICDTNSSVIRVFADHLNGEKITKIPVDDLIGLFCLSQKYMLQKLHLDVSECLLKWLEKALSEKFALNTDKSQQIVHLLQSSLQYDCEWFSQQCLGLLMSSGQTLEIKQQVVSKSVQMNNLSLLPDLKLAVKHLL